MPASASVGRTWIQQADWTMTHSPIHQIEDFEPLLDDFHALQLLHGYVAVAMNDRATQQCDLI